MFVLNQAEDSNEGEMIIDSNDMSNQLSTIYAKNYIFAVEDFIGTKISSISTSPEREDTILIENPFEV